MKGRRGGIRALSWWELLPSFTSGSEWGNGEIRTRVATGVSQGSRRDVGAPLPEKATETHCSQEIPRQDGARQLTHRVARRVSQTLKNREKGEIRWSEARPGCRPKGRRGGTRALRWWELLPSLTSGSEWGNGEIRPRVAPGVLVGNRWDGGAPLQEKPTETHCSHEIRRYAGARQLTHRVATRVSQTLKNGKNGEIRWPEARPGWRSKGRRGGARFRKRWERRP